MSTKPSLKIDIIIHDIKVNNPNYKLFLHKEFKAYIRKKYKCSAYMANQVLEILFKNDGTTID